MVWSPKARADLRRIDRQTAMRILQAIDLYSRIGEGDVKSLQPPLTGRRLRVGDWRVIFTPVPGLEEIHIDEVRHRSDAY
ncbi:MAG: type II toxin-antitoxin system RelE/ParE family toxin [Candidatus Solibacter usitatus]|nr:type II toxin-antitoxin system RelE/ParE family toxin [Candidatus Solibacter usitatus]